MTCWTQAYWVKPGLVGPISGFDSDYPHDGRADKNPYLHNRRADKDSYPHDSNNQIRVVSANFWGGSFRPKKASRFGPGLFRL